MAIVGAGKGESAIILDMDPASREACMAAGCDQITLPAGAPKITQLSSDYCAPDDVDSAYRDVARFSHFGPF